MSIATGFPCKSQFSRWRQRIDNDERKARDSGGRTDSGIRVLDLKKELIKFFILNKLTMRHQWYRFVRCALPAEKSKSRLDDQDSDYY